MFTWIQWGRSFTSSSFPLFSITKRKRNFLENKKDTKRIFFSSITPRISQAVFYKGEEKKEKNIRMKTNIVECQASTIKSFTCARIERNIRETMWFRFHSRVFLSLYFIWRKFVGKCLWKHDTSWRHLWFSILERKKTHFLLFFFFFFQLINWLAWYKHFKECVEEIKFYYFLFYSYFV